MPCKSWNRLEDWVFEQYEVMNDGVKKEMSVVR